MIQPGQIYRSADPRGGPRIRIERFTPGHNHVWAVDAQNGKRARWILIRNLHATATTKTGARRRTGYVLEQSDVPEPEVDPGVQAFLDLHAPLAFPLADHGRACGGPAVPQLRPITDVLTTL
ncbi:hypothetical protein [Streptomyces sp. NPDC015130]|uniref:hypothetical protein n=1 Tax=Streptomyces sp. NPDC015130 TaxID=3364940 RepID=UPI0036FCCA14